MAITYVASSTPAHGVANASSVAVAYPAVAPNANDLLIMIVGTDNLTGTINTPSGWTKVDDQVGGTGTPAAAAGQRRVIVFWRRATGSESGTETMTLTGGTTTIISGAMAHWRSNTAGEQVYIVSSTWGQDSTDAVNASIPGQVTLSETVNDWMLWAYCDSDNSNWGSTTYTSTGVSAYGTAAERVDSGTANGNDLRIGMGDRQINTGTATGVPTVTSTIAVANCSVAIMMRLDEQTIPTGGPSFREPHYRTYGHLLRR